MGYKETYGFTEEEWQACTTVLSVLKDDPRNNPDNPFFSGLITKIAKKAKKKMGRVTDERATAIMRNAVIAKAAIEGRSNYGTEHESNEHYFTRIDTDKNCYSCNTPYHNIHSFYHRLCPLCVAENLTQRWRTVDLSGRNVVLTGGRVKVGYATALKLLRAGANLTVTTRFPALALASYQKEEDYADWKDRLSLYGLDLRMLQDVEAFISHYTSKHPSLDILINNAAQTIQYDEAYYAPIVSTEHKLLAQPPQVGMHNLVRNTRLPTARAIGYSDGLSELELNRFGQPVDLREKTSWNATLKEIDAFELMEVNLINQISPFLLIKAFTPLLKQSSFASKHIVNVTSSEGQFSYTNKTMFHPHTNMTKAALNMMTLTSAQEYEKERIYMNSVDVGWISTGAKEVLRERQFKEGYIPPLDPVDGAARIMHPIIDQLTQQNTYVGKLLKHYKVQEW